MENKKKILFCFESNKKAKIVLAYFKKFI